MLPTLNIVMLQIMEIRLLWFVFRHDTDQDGVVSIREVALVFRSIGCNPTEAELQVL